MTRLGASLTWGRGCGPSFLTRLSTLPLLFSLYSLFSPVLKHSEYAANIKVKVPSLLLRYGCMSLIGLIDFFFVFSYTTVRLNLLDINNVTRFRDRMKVIKAGSRAGRNGDRKSISRQTCWEENRKRNKTYNSVL